MNPIKIVAIVIVAAGVAALAYGRFSYTKDSSTARIGPMEMTVKDKRSVEVPAWVGFAAIAVGGAMLFAPIKR